MSNQTLDQKVVIIILNRIILPMVGFKMLVLMNSPFGKFTYTNGGILMSFQKKFLVVMLSNKVYILTIS